MEDHALAKAFPRVSSFIVRIAVLRNGETIGTGTGYIVGGLRKTHRAVLATARHLLPFLAQTDPVGYGIRLESYDDEMKLRRSVTFPIGQHDDSEGYHLAYDHAPEGDVAVLVAPRKADDGKDFLESLDSLDLSIPPVQDRAGPGPATRIAWAGFPGLLAKPEMFGAPQLCYYEGVVSCWARKAGRLIVVVDGHAMPGVSGGPLWFFNETARSVQVAGIVSAYASNVPEPFMPFSPDSPAAQKRDRMPGFVFVQPIFGLMAHVLRFGKSEPSEESTGR